MFSGNFREKLLNSVRNFFEKIGKLYLKLTFFKQNSRTKNAWKKCLVFPQKFCILLFNFRGIFSPDSLFVLTQKKRETGMKTNEYIPIGPMVWSGTTDGCIHQKSAKTIQVLFVLSRVCSWEFKWVPQTHSRGVRLVTHCFPFLDRDFPLLFRAIHSTNQKTKTTKQEETFFVKQKKRTRKRRNQNNWARIVLISPWFPFNWIAWDSNEQTRNSHVSRIFYWKLWEGTGKTTMRSVL